MFPHNLTSALIFSALFKSIQFKLSSFSYFHLKLELLVQAPCRALISTVASLPTVSGAVYAFFATFLSAKAWWLVVWAACTPKINFRVGGSVRYLKWMS